MDEYEEYLARRTEIIRQAEQRRQDPPTTYDYTFVRHLLRDFGLRKKVPLFDSFRDLMLWKNKQIREGLR